MVFLYKNKNPAINETVIAHITEINDLNIVATLVDYDNLTGYISYSELSRKKRYKLNKIVTVGKDTMVQVTGFNDKKKYAELSVRALIPSDIENFNKAHRKYTNLYNLWRFVYMKLNPELKMNIENINSHEINTFMEKTFWKIENYLEENSEDINDTKDTNKLYDMEKNENYNLDELYNVLINSSKNESLLKYIEEYDTKAIKNILDNYAQIKFVPTKQTKFQEFNIYSFECDGLNNIKNALDYKSYDKWNELMNKYDISILYLTGGKYSLSIKQKMPLEENINDVCEYLIQQIKKNCELNNIIFNI